MKRKTTHQRFFSVYLVVGLLMGGAASQGQNRGGMFPAAQRAQQLLDRMTQALSDVAASEDQHKKIDPILDDARLRLRDLAQDLIPDPPIVRRQKLVEFLNALEGKVTANLTAEQSQSFREKAGDFHQELLGNFVARGGRGATSQPDMAPGARPQKIGTVVERLRDYLNQIDLSDSQKGEIDALFSDTRKKLQQIEQGQGEASAQQQQQQAVIQDLRQELSVILTPDQFGRLRTAVNQGAPNGGGMGGGGGMAMMPPAANAPTAGAGAAVAAAEPEILMLEIGQAAPDFSLRGIDGTPAQLSKMNGRLVLLVFGSYSSPSFRERAASLDKINHDYANRVVTLVIYTRENHPVGDANVDRNQAENVAVEQPADMNGRITLARQACSTLKVNFPILMDSMDDATAKAYGGFTNAAYLIGRDGRILARQKWFEPYAMRADINEALAKEPR